MRTTCSKRYMYPRASASTHEYHCACARAQPLCYAFFSPSVSSARYAHRGRTGRSAAKNESGRDCIISEEEVSEREMKREGGRQQSNKDERRSCSESRGRRRYVAKMFGMGGTQRIFRSESFMDVLPSHRCCLTIFFSVRASFFLARPLRTGLCCVRKLSFANAKKSVVVTIVGTEGNNKCYPATYSLGSLLGLLPMQWGNEFMGIRKKATGKRTAITKGRREILSSPPDS